MKLIQSVLNRAFDNLYNREESMITPIKTLSMFLVTVGVTLSAIPAAKTEPIVTEVASFPVNRPTGIAVAPDERLFVSLPYSAYSDDLHEASVVEIVEGGEPRAFPNIEWNAKAGPVESRFLNIQSLTIDAAGHLWLLDTGSPRRQGVVEGGAKLVEIDLDTNAVIRVLPFDSNVVSDSDYLNDVRVDSNRNTAYVTDSVRGGIVVMDLATGSHRRVMTNHPHLATDALVTPVVETISLGNEKGKPSFPATDGIALSRDGQTVYVMYRPLSGSRSLIALPSALLRNPDVPNTDITAAAELVAIAVIADGIEVGPDDRVYFTDLERNAISRLEDDGTIGIVATSPDLSWPDAIGFAPDGSIYTTTPRFHHLSVFNKGRDVSQSPFKVFRINLSN